jgi:hypothetical protein
MTADHDEVFLAEYPWWPADLPQSILDKAYDADDPPVHIPLHELENFSGLPPLRKNNLKLKPAQECKQLQLMDQPQSPQHMLMTMMQMVLAQNNAGVPPVPPSSPAGLPGLQMFAPKPRATSPVDDRDACAGSSSASGTQAALFDMPLMGTQGKQRDAEEDIDTSIDEVTSADAQSKLVLKAMAAREAAKEEAKAQANAVHKKPASKVSAKVGWAKQVKGDVPKKLKTKFKDGCSKCRYCKGCTRSCWKGRGFDV